MKMKKKSKKIKSNKNNKDYNWNKKTIWGQLLILVGSTWLSRKEEKKERGKKIQYQQNHHDSPHTRCLIEFVDTRHFKWHGSQRYLAIIRCT